MLNQLAFIVGNSWSSDSAALIAQTTMTQCSMVSASHCHNIRGDLFHTLHIVFYRLHSHHRISHISFARSICGISQVDITILGLFVDDILIIGLNEQKIVELKRELQLKFGVRDWDLPPNFLEWTSTEHCLTWLLAEGLCGIRPWRFNRKHIPQTDEDMNDYMTVMTKPLMRHFYSELSLGNLSQRTQFVPVVL